MKQRARPKVDPPVAVGTGLVALDLVYGTGSAAVERRYAGGTCGNVMAILAYLGWRSYPVARLRPGAAAEWVRRDLARFGVMPDFLARRRTGSTPIIVQRIEMGQDGRPHHRFSGVARRAGRCFLATRPCSSRRRSGWRRRCRRRRSSSSTASRAAR